MVSAATPQMLQRQPMQQHLAGVPTYGNTVTGQPGSTGNPLLDLLRHATNMDANARLRGARLAGMNASPNDPSMAAYGGLSALLGGQSDAATSLGQTATSYGVQQQAQSFEELMTRLKAKLQEDQIKASMGSPWAQFGGQVIGRGIGAYLRG